MGARHNITISQEDYVKLYAPIQDKKVAKKAEEKNHAPKTKENPKIVPHIFSHTIHLPTKTVSLPTLGVTADESSGESEGEYGSENEDGIVNVNPTHLVDITTSKPKQNSASQGGRPRNDLLDRLLQKCATKRYPDKHLYRWIGSFGTTFSNYLCAKVKLYAASKAPSRQLTKANSVGSLPSSSGAMSESSGGPSMGAVVPLKRKKPPTEVVSSPWFDEAKKLGKWERHKQLDLEVVKFYCVAGLQTHIVSLPCFTTLIQTANPTYTPLTCNKLEEVLIIGKAENIQATQIAYLKTQFNITVSCDGSTNTGREGFWTVHMSIETR
ncbi:hypothetical protein CPC08DRAFT_808781 [Agrocybe pediades]|nr:hypothetical protein CPC08DRAFT_808781 [Agrocybe pediades]